MHPFTLQYLLHPVTFRDYVRSERGRILRAAKLSEAGSLNSGISIPCLNVQLNGMNLVAGLLKAQAPTSRHTGSLCDDSL